MLQSFKQAASRGHCICATFSPVAVLGELSVVGHWLPLSLECSVVASRAYLVGGLIFGTEGNDKLTIDENSDLLVSSCC
jgi:hypothetical protein